MVENRVRIIMIVIVIVSIFLLEKEAQSKELSMSVQLGGVKNMDESHNGGISERWEYGENEVVIMSDYGQKLTCLTFSCYVCYRWFLKYIYELIKRIKIPKLAISYIGLIY